MICGDLAELYTNNLREKTTNAKYKIQKKYAVLVSGPNTTVNIFVWRVLYECLLTTSNSVTAYDTRSVRITADKVEVLGIRSDPRIRDPPAKIMFGARIRARK